MLLAIALLVSGVLVTSTLLDNGKQSIETSNELATEFSDNLFDRYNEYNVLGSEILNFIDNYWKFDQELKLKIHLVGGDAVVTTYDYIYADRLELRQAIDKGDIKVTPDAIFSSDVSENDGNQIIEFTALTFNETEEYIVREDSYESYMRTLKEFITYLRDTTSENSDYVDYVNTNFNGVYSMWDKLANDTGYNWDAGTVNYKSTLNLTFKMLDRLLGTTIANETKVQPTTQELQDALDSLTGGIITTPPTESGTFTLASYTDTDKVVALGTGSYSLKMGDADFVTMSYKEYQRMRIKSGAFCNDNGRQVQTIFLKGTNLTGQDGNGNTIITTPGIYVEDYAFVKKADLMEQDGRLVAKPGKESALKTIIVTEDTGLYLAPNALAGCEDVEIIFMTKKTYSTNEIANDGWDNNRHELNCVKYFRELTLNSLKEEYGEQAWIDNYKASLDTAFTGVSYYLWSGIMANNPSQGGVANFRHLSRVYAFSDSNNLKALNNSLSLYSRPYNLESKTDAKNRNNASSFYRKGYPSNVLNVQSSLYKVPCETSNIPGHETTMGAKSLTLHLNNRYTDYETSNVFYEDESNEKHTEELEISKSYDDDSTTTANTTKRAGDVYDTLVYTLPTSNLIYDAVYSGTYTMYASKSGKTSDATIDNALSLCECFDNGTSWEEMNDYIESFEHPEYKLRRRQVELYVEDGDIHNASGKINTIILHTNWRHFEGKITLNLTSNKVSYSHLILQPYAGSYAGSSGILKDSTSKDTWQYLRQYTAGTSGNSYPAIVDVKDHLESATTDNPNFSGETCRLTSVSYPLASVSGFYDKSTGRLKDFGPDPYAYNNRFSVTESQKIKVEDNVEYKGKTYAKKITFMLNTYTIKHKTASGTYRYSVVGPVFDRFTIELR